MPVRLISYNGDIVAVAQKRETAVAWITQRVAHVRRVHQIREIASLYGVSGGISTDAAFAALDGFSAEEIADACDDSYYPKPVSTNDFHLKVWNTVEEENP